LIRSVVPPVVVVEPELPGAGVVVPPVDGVEPELPGSVVPPVDGVTGLAGVFVPAPNVGVVAVVVTTVDFTGVVARVTKVAVFLTTAGVGFVDAAVLVVFPPPELLEPPLDELADHWATHVRELAGIVKFVPAA
jgi:hypothetical protein